MSGILDKKSRIMDVVLTNEGRNALAKGNFSIKYYGFTDIGSLYQKSQATGSLERGDVFQLESHSSPHDLITLAADENGFITSQNKISGSAVSSGKIYNISSEEYLSGSAYSAVVDTLLDSTEDSFKSNRFILSNDDLFETSDFNLAPSSIVFDNYKEQVVKVDLLETLFEDQLLSDSVNFLYLPPINLPTDSTLDVRDESVIKQNLLADYPRLNNPRSYTRTDLDLELKEASAAGRLKKVNFNPNTRFGNINFQIFEKSNETLTKLDVIQWEKDKDVFFVGKTLENSFGSSTFVNLFIIQLENDDEGAFL